MILSDREIWMEVGSGRLTFSPELEPSQVGPSSIDLRLGNEFTVFNPPRPGLQTTIDLAKLENVETVAESLGSTVTRSNGEPFQLDPGLFVLAYTLEYIAMPNYLAARVEGRSSLARLGISVHQTAPTVHATFEGQLRLEISHNGPYPCLIYPEQRICQLVIERLGSPSTVDLDSLFQRQRQG